MHHLNARLVFHSSLLAISTAAMALPALAAKPPIPYSVEDSWRSVSNPTLSNDGLWVAYGAHPELGDGTLIVRNIQSGREYRESRAASAIEGQPDKFAFTEDSRYLVFSIDPPYAEVKAAQRLKKKLSEQPKPGVGILNLQTGEVVRYMRATGFKLPGKNSNAVAILREPSADEEAGASSESTEALPADLIVRDLRSGAEQTLANVVDYGLTSDGKWVAYIVKTPQQKSKAAPSPLPSPTPTPTAPPTAAPGAAAQPEAAASASPAPNPKDGVYVSAVGSQNSAGTPILRGSAVYKSLLLSDYHPQLAFLSDLGTHAAKRPAWSLYYWTPGQSTASRVASPSSPMVPKGYDVSDYGTLSFSKDGQRLFVDVAPIAKAKPAPHAPEPLKVDIWWSKEPDIPPAQTAASMARKFDVAGVVQLASRRFVLLGTTGMRIVEHNETSRYGVGLGSGPYHVSGTWRYANCDYYLYCDVYLVDMQNGSRRMIEPREWNHPMLSPSGKYILIFDGAKHHWFTVRTSDLRRVTLTAGNTHFESVNWDQADYPGSYGLMGWAPGDRSVFVYDKYDIWQFDPDTGAGRQITAGFGRAHQTPLRYVSLNPDAEYHSMPGFGDRTSNVTNEKVDTSKPVILLGMNENTKAESLFNFTVDGNAHAPVLRTQQNVMFGAPAVARNNPSLLVMARERFDMEADLYATTPSFPYFHRLTNVEPRQQQYAWGSDRLFTYTNADGVPLKAILYLPPNFDPHKKYPLVEYEYEIKSDTLNEFYSPAPVISADINITWYASNGYVVVVPDIIYKVGHPGMSAVHCIVPAVKRVIAMGFIDPKRVGMTGHSWGGFQSQFLATHSNIFTAFAAGAGISDLLSWNDQLRWGLGNPGMAHLEIFQGRMGGDLWHNFNTFRENSSVFDMLNEHAPFLLLHNDADGNVSWFQGIEWFLAMRRNGKDGWLINYNGEDHGIYKSRDDQKDWTVRMDQFLAHYLKGDPAPDWMREPILNEDRGSLVNVRKFGEP